MVTAVDSIVPLGRIAMASVKVMILLLGKIAMRSVKRVNMVLQTALTMITMV